MQKCADLVDLENMSQNEFRLAKIGFDTAENESSKIWQFAKQIQSVRKLRGLRGLSTTSVLEEIYQIYVLTVFTLGRRKPDQR